MSPGMYVLNWYSVMINETKACMLRSMLLKGVFKDEQVMISWCAASVWEVPSLYGHFPPKSFRPDYLAPYFRKRNITF